MESLKAKTASGLFWSVFDSFGVYVVKFGFSVAIARTLSPDDYGLMGMIVIFISLGQALMQGGFSSALIQKKEATPSDLSTAFWFNVMAALTIWAILFFSAGAIADFFDRPILVNITRVASIGIILNSMSSVHVAILTRQLNFRRQTWLSLAGALISGITGLSLALSGFEVWALVFQTLAGNLIYMAGLWITSKWRPLFVFNRVSFMELFGFGYKVLLQGITDVVFTKAYFPLIGKLYTARDLGFYTNANRFYELFIRQSSISVTRVIYPAFSIVQDDRERFNKNYVKSFNMLSMIMFAGTVILIAASRPFISLALTEKWLPAVPYMQLFFLDGFFFPLLIFNQSIILSSGRSGLTLKIDILRKASILASILLIWRLGIKALILGQVASTAVALAASLFAVVKNQGVRPASLSADLSKLAVISGLCMAVNYAVVRFIPMSDWTELILKCSVLVLIFLALSRLMRVRALDDIRAFAADHIPTLSR
jgi:O-antigen/teichoic acid export membrane protein